MKYLDMRDIRLDYQARGNALVKDGDPEDPEVHDLQQSYLV